VYNYLLIDKCIIFVLCLRILSDQGISPSDEPLKVSEAFLNCELSYNVKKLVFEQKKKEFSTRSHRNTLEVVLLRLL